MTREKAFEVVRSAILEADPVIKESDITNSAVLNADLGLQSLDVVEVCMYVETKLNLDDATDKFQHIDLNKVTVQDIVDIVEKL
jgi:acyl carrier protein